VKTRLPYISIITVNLNNLQGLIHTFESVGEQVYSNSEHIIIDGASNDGSVEFLIKNTRKNTYWTSESDFGIYDAMNKGIVKAQGEWIIFMNSGDKFYDKFTIYNLFSNHSVENIDIIYGNTIYKNSIKPILVPLEVSKQYFFNNTICHQSLFANKELFKKIGFFNLDYKYIADREWLLRAKLSNMNFLYVNAFIAIWDPEGACINNLTQFRKEIKKMRLQYFNKFELIILQTLNILIKLIKRSTIKVTAFKFPI